MTQYRRGTTHAIASYTCCEETKNAILVGVEEPGKAATKRGKAHLQPLQNKLNTSQLLEYCFMMWGLSEAQARDLYQTVPQNLKYVAIESPQQKK